ncbi:MAG: hypothetical protein HOO89_06800 [Ferruginibacter sp.]|nr:hypothetical protein [Ferruginibacter sp.]
MQETIKKLKFKNKAIILNSPISLINDFIELGFGTKISRNKKSCNTLVFIDNNKQFVDFLNNELKNIEFDSVLWFAYPKGTSKIKTDINRDTIRITGEKYGITTVTAISISDTWSALRFRSINKVGK